MKKQILFLALFLATTTIMAQETVASWNFNPTFQLNVSSTTGSVYPTVEFPIQILIEGPANQSLIYTLNYGEQLGGEWIDSPNSLDINTNNFNEAIMFTFTNNEVYGGRAVVFELTNNFNQTIIQEITFDVQNPSQVLNDLYVEFSWTNENPPNNDFNSFEIYTLNVTPNLIDNSSTVQDIRIKRNGEFINIEQIIFQAGTDNNINPQNGNCYVQFIVLKSELDEDLHINDQLEMSIQDSLGFWTNFIDFEIVW